jgi:hypothetical protein
MCPRSLFADTIKVSTKAIILTHTPAVHTVRTVRLPLVRTSTGIFFTLVKESEAGLRDAPPGPGPSHQFSPCGCGRRKEGQLAVSLIQGIIHGGESKLNNGPQKGVGPDCEPLC